MKPETIEIDKVCNGVQGQNMLRPIEYIATVTYTVECCKEEYEEGIVIEAEIVKRDYCITDNNGLEIPHLINRTDLQGILPHDDDIRNEAIEEYKMQ